MREWRVFRNCEEGNKGKQGKVIAVAKKENKSSKKGPSPPRLGKDQCAICKN